ncbi:MAG: HEAT repeat domain-containing protein [Verrucomicrobia bacterium]|nr:HEAT repeat domain-containing protein [Verrucomicrobiota bacterium]
MRSRAIKSLGRLGAPEALESLAAILEADPVGDTSVPSMDEPSEAIQRRNAATAIGSIGGKESLPLLRKLAARKNEYFTVRDELQWSLGKVESETKE